MPMPPLQDASARANRRTSFGGSCNESPVKEPTKDRRAMLDEWRKSRGRSPARATSSAESRCDGLERAESTIDLPQPPPAVQSSIDQDKENHGLSALERYRLRKMKNRGHADDANEPTMTMTMGTPTRNRLPPHPPSNSASASSYTDDEDNTIGYSSYAVGTPSRRPKSRRSLSCGGAQRKVRRRTMGLAQEPAKSKPLLPPSYSAAAPPCEAQEADIQTSTKRESIQEPESFSQGSMDSVDGVAMKSRIQAMQRRIDNLEREKMELSMAKAPLEARMRQKEDAWVKERERLLAEIEDHELRSKEVDERYRELEMQNEALNEEAKKFRLEARAATSTADGREEKDSWSERLKTNREITQLRDELKGKEDEIKSLRIEKVSLESEVYGCQNELQRLTRDYDELEMDLKELESSKSQNSEAEIQLQALATEHTAMTAQLNATNADLEETRSRAKADVKSKEDNWKQRESDLLFEISVLKTRARKSEVCNTSIDITDGEEDIAILKARIEARDRRVQELEAQLVKGEQIRRAMHNRIQELRGNIRVFVRTRPFLPNDGVASHSSIDILPDGESLSILGNRGCGETHGFKFDKVFAPSAGQDVVFDEVSEFVQSALDGYHVCLFSYGQTGSGKTHTMQGSGNKAMRGVIPRAVEQILAQAELMQAQRWKFTVKASFLEIYNEELRDLLVMMNSDGSVRPRDTRSATKKLAIKRNAEGKSFVDGLNMVTIDVENKRAGLEQLEAVMAAAARARSVATTKMNAQSSRSHSVFMLHLFGSNEESGTVIQGALNLCDLAGSERLDRSGASSDAMRLKETQAINKSLSCLGDVFTALTNGSKHIPFRNSKLTYLLQDCLSGDGKALMFVNLSPTIESSNESLCSLRFAQRVNQVELGRAIKNVQYSKGGSKK